MDMEETRLGSSDIRLPTKKGVYMLHHGEEEI
jgi:hypothetical protein